jgi:SAM-dependent methyltransferase
VEAATSVGSRQWATAQEALPPCLYCGEAAYERLFQGVRDRLGYVPGTWAFDRCRQCGSAILVPHPRAADLAAFYPPVYSFTPELGQESRFRRILAKLEYRFFFRPQYQAQVRGVLRGIGWQRQPGQRLLDVGCGRGLRLLVFQRYGFEVQGMDFQTEVVEYVRKQVGVPAVCTDVEGLTTHFPRASFDIVTAFYVLEHVPDVRAVLRSCFDLLKPGGWFVGAIPFVDGVQPRVFKSRWINVTEAPRHLSIPSHEGIRRACLRVGYDRVAFRPDAVLNCAGMIGSSLVPGAAITDVYGGGRVLALLRRLLGGVITLLSVPGCLVENYLFRRPSLGMVLAHKPDVA